MSFNKITLVGNLGKDPELRYTPQGDAVANFTMATTERRKDKSGEFADITLWWKITVWRRQAENASKYLFKGSQVYIEGRLAVEEWTDRDNRDRYTLAVTASDMQFIGSKAEGSGDGVDRSRQYDQTARSAEFPTHSGPATSQPALPAVASSIETANPRYPAPPPLNIPDDDIPF